MNELSGYNGQRISLRIRNNGGHIVDGNSSINNANIIDINDNL